MSSRWSFTRFYDEVGPLEVNKLLFRAYNLAATPRSVSPFIVRLHSPRDDVAAAIDRYLPNFAKSAHHHDRQYWTLSASAPGFKEAPVRQLSIAGTSLHAFGNGLYVWRRSARSTTRPMRWDRIARNVEARAA